MRVLITGATGLVGTALAAALQRHGHTIHYLTTSLKEKPVPNAKAFLWDAKQGTMDESSLEGVDAIIHLAGAPISGRWTTSYKQEIIESRVMTAHLLYKALKNYQGHKVKQFISASAIGLYASDFNHFYHEDDKKYDDGFLGNVVMKWEESADRFRLLNIKVVKIRTGLVLAAKGGILEQLARPVRFYMGTAFGSGKQWQSWIHIDDLVGIYAAALEQGWEGSYNAVAPNPVTQNSLMKAVGKALKKPVFLPNVPQIMMKLALGEMHELLFTSQKVSADKVRKSGYDFTFNELPAALNDLLKP